MQAKIIQDFPRQQFEIYLFDRDGDYIIKDTESGKEIVYKKVERGIKPKPMLSINAGNFKSAMQALVNAAAEDLDIFPEKSNKDKIKAESLNDEKDNQIDWFKEQVEKIVDNNLL